jgi:N-acetylglutamate synthase-like GNAT family acetyltransferase
VITVGISIIRKPAGSECSLILSVLPEWFGIPAANAALVQQADSDLTFVAEMTRQPVGIMTLCDTGFAALEIRLLAVLPEMRLHGIGKMLIDRAAVEARCLGKEYLLVKTLGPSRPSEHYAQTRGFYNHNGFLAVEESVDTWGPENPCLYMIRAVNSD